MERLNGLSKALLVVAIIGAINWGLVGFFNWNLVDAIFGGGAREQTSGLSRFIYSIVGLCGLAAIPVVFGRRQADPPHGHDLIGGRHRAAAPERLRSCRRS
jgi:uncharacterized membrane protein YuzA (DUF378 family)